MSEQRTRAAGRPRADHEGNRIMDEPAVGDVDPALPPLRLLLADNAPMRLGMRLSLPPSVTVCGEVDTPEHAIRRAQALQPDACFVGRQLLGPDFTPLRGICRAAPTCSVVVFATDEDSADMVDAVRAGALGYVPGPLTAERLRTVVRAVAHREAIVPRALTRELVLAVRDGVSETALLTGREAEVLRMLRRGQSTREIAERLAIAPVTVRRHVSELVRKLGVANRAALVDAAD